MHKSAHIQRIDYVRQQLESLKKLISKSLTNRTRTLPNREFLDHISTVLGELHTVLDEADQQDGEMIRTQSQRALANERTPYQAFFEFNSHGCLITDLAGVILEVNRPAASLLNLSQESIIGKPLLPFIGKEDRQDFHRRLNRLSRNGLQRPKVWKCQMQPHAAEVLPVAMTLAPLHDSNNRLTGLCWLIRDRKDSGSIEEQLGASLRKSTELFEKIFGSGHILIALMDKDFNFIRVNRTYAEADERDVSFYVGKNHFTLFPNDQNEAIFRKVVATGEPYFAFDRAFEYAEHPERGVSHWNWSLQPLKEADGKVSELLLVLINRTESKIARETAQSEHAFRKAIEDSLVAGITAVDLDGRQSYVNAAFCKMVGWSQEELLGALPPFVYWPPEDREDLTRVLQEVLNGQVSAKGREVRFHRRNEERFDALILPSPLEDSQGRVIGWIESITDITELKETERRVGHSNNLLELFAKTSSRKEYLDAATNLIQSWSGCRCVGVRILSDDGYIPYESYLGFSQEFWQSESWLSINHDQCACIRIINRSPEPQDIPAMTEAGSFYCNDTLQFLNELSENERKRFRGVCIQTGFASVAIIPVYYREKVLGAIHLTDERRGKVPLKMVEFLESMAPLMGEALYRFTLEEELRENFDKQNFVNSLLSLALENTTLEELFNLAFSLLVLVPSLGFEPKGAIFLVEETPEALILKAHKGLPESVKTACGRVSFGECLCGQAAVTGKLQFAKELDNYSGICCKDTDLPGHYCVPLMSSDKILGVIKLFLKKGARRDTRREGFLLTIADVLVGIIKRKKAEEALQESEKQLRILSSQLISAQENERKRVAQELHDGIGQRLAAIKFKIESTQFRKRKSVSPAKDNPMNDIIPMIQTAVEEVRRIQMDLRPAILDDLGLLATIGWLTREFHAIYSAIQVVNQIDITESDVPNPLKIVIYRVLQEALNNIAKHSQADLVRLSLRKTDAGIELTIEDNGQGFNLEEVRLVDPAHGKGFGLASMRERTELSEGTFSVKSTKGIGTTLRASWPY